MTIATVARLSEHVGSTVTEPGGVGDVAEDAVVAGVNEALRLAKEHGEAKMAAVTGGLPGIKIDGRFVHVAARLISSTCSLSVHRSYSQPRPNNPPVSR